MIKMAGGFLDRINKNGVACRFLTIDADIEKDKELPQFYVKNHFVKNTLIALKLYQCGKIFTYNRQILKIKNRKISGR
jgi:hypothetical protein